MVKCEVCLSCMRQIIIIEEGKFLACKLCKSVYAFKTRLDIKKVEDQALIDKVLSKVNLKVID